MCFLLFLLVSIECIPMVWYTYGMYTYGMYTYGMYTYGMYTYGNFWNQEFSGMPKILEQRIFGNEEFFGNDEFLGMTNFPE